MNRFSPLDQPSALAGAIACATPVHIEEIFLAHQPILDRAGRLVSHELLFHGGRVDHAGVSGDLHASSTVVHNTLTEMGTVGVLGQVLGYVNVDRAFLRASTISMRLS
jgi:c-di-GMP-related signal transduction protein